MTPPADVVLLPIRARPGSRRPGVRRAADGALIVAVAARPVGGEANRAVLTTLAAALRVAPSAVTIARGGSGREKLVRIAGVTNEAVRAALTPRGEDTGR